MKRLLILALALVALAGCDTSGTGAAPPANGVASATLTPPPTLQQGHTTSIETFDSPQSQLVSRASSENDPDLCQQAEAYQDMMGVQHSAEEARNECYQLYSINHPENQQCGEIVNLPPDGEQQAACRFDAALSHPSADACADLPAASPRYDRTACLAQRAQARRDLGSCNQMPPDSGQAYLDCFYSVIGVAAASSEADCRAAMVRPELALENDNVEPDSLAVAQCFGGLVRRSRDPSICQTTFRSRFAVHACQSGLAGPPQEGAGSISEPATPAVLRFAAITQTLETQDFVWIQGVGGAAAGSSPAPVAWDGITTAQLEVIGSALGGECLALAKQPIPAGQSLVVESDGGFTPARLDGGAPFGLLAAGPNSVACRLE